MKHQDWRGSIINAAMSVHTALRPGLLESTYEACLVHELKKRGLKVQSQLALPVHYDGVEIELGYRLDLLVENSVIVELKELIKQQQCMRRRCCYTSN